MFIYCFSIHSNFAKMKQYFRHSNSGVRESELCFPLTRRTAGVFFFFFLSFFKVTILMIIMQRICVTFIQFSSVLTSCTTLVQYHNQETGSDTVHPSYPEFTRVSFVCVCVCLYFLHFPFIYFQFFFFFFFLIGILACQCRKHKRCGFDPRVKKIP